MSSSTPVRTITVLTAVAAAVLGALLPASGAVAAPAKPVAATSGDTVRVIVTYDRVASGPSVAREVGRSGKVTRTMKRTPHLVAKVPRGSIAALRRAPHVKAVQLDIPDPVNLDGSLPVINADDVHAGGVTGAGATVAILDTGVDIDHPFLGGRVISQYCSSSP